MSAAEQPPFPLIVGAGRSGTTLLRVMLSRHPDLAIPPESWFLVPLAHSAARYETPDGFDLDRFAADLLLHRRFRDWQLDEGLFRERISGIERGIDLAEAVRRTYSLFAETHGKTRAGEKTPHLINHTDEMLQLFPTGRFIHLQRDGRDVAASVVGMPWGPNLLSHASVQWRNRITRGRAAGERIGPERYLEVRYEDLIAEPKATLERICAFIDLDFDEAMLDQARTDGVVPPRERGYHTHLAEPLHQVRDWRTDMKPSDVALVELIAGDALSMCGYDLVSGPPSTATKLRSWGGRLATKIGRRRNRLKRALVQRRNPPWPPSGAGLPADEEDSPRDA